ncbi:MAG: D-glycero-alpha-D-manno-heptose-1,7-bisphosphate 7-phosphatase [Dehalococcoidia bacterium]
MATSHGNRAKLEPSTYALSTMEGNLHLPLNSRLNTPPPQEAQPNTKGAVFVDRDGVIIEDVHYLRESRQIRILPGVVPALRSLQQHFYIIVVTNQSGIARGLLSEADLSLIHSDLVYQLAAQDTFIDALYYCPHLPQATVAKYRIICACRKPKGGMLLQAQSDWAIDLTRSFIVGDMLRDIEAGRAAGVRGVLIAADEPKGHLPEGLPPTPVASDLVQAASYILAHPLNPAPG